MKGLKRIFGKAFGCGSETRSEIGVARFVRTRGEKMFASVLAARTSVRSRLIINERGPRGIGSEKERGWERRKSRDGKEGEPECIARYRLVLIVIPDEGRRRGNTADEYIVLNFFIRGILSRQMSAV